MRIMNGLGERHRRAVQLSCSTFLTRIPQNGTRPAAEAPAAKAERPLHLQDAQWPLETLHIASSHCRCKLCSKIGEPLGPRGCTAPRQARALSQAQHRPSPVHNAQGRGAGSSTACGPASRAGGGGSGGAAAAAGVAAAAAAAAAACAAAAMAAAAVAAVSPWQPSRDGLGGRSRRAGEQDGTELVLPHLQLMS